MGEHISCLSKPSWTHLTVKKCQKQLKISQKPVCRQLGEPKLIFKGGFTKPTFRARSFLFSHSFLFSTGLACGGGVPLAEGPLSASIHLNVPPPSGHFDGLIQVSQHRRTYFLSFKTLLDTFDRVKVAKTAENIKKTCLPATR